MAFLAWDLIFAHRFLAAFEIFALPAADSTRFLVLVRSRPAALPRAFAANCKPFKSPCSFANCFLTFFSSRLIDAKMLMSPPSTLYLRNRHTPIPCLRSVHPTASHDRGGVIRG